MRSILHTFLLFAFFLNACGDGERQTPVESELSEGVEVSFAIRLSKLAAATMSRAEVVITASDMEDIRQELTLDGSKVTGAVQGIPSGSERLFTLNGYDVADQLIYTGYSKVDLPPGEIVTVRITMRRIGGATGSPQEITVNLPGDADMEMVWIEPGTFLMGTTEEQEQLLRNKGLWIDYIENEFPAHEVTISQGFWLGKYEVTQEQWVSVMGTQPWEGIARVQENPNHPAVDIMWEDWQKFIEKLNQAEGGEVYRLPTEAEWEYACRAGTNTLWSFGDDENQLGDYAWYADNALDAGEQYGHPVGMKLPNPWGLFDMQGNVWEWCQDLYGEYSSGAQIDPTGPASVDNYVQRGGDFDDRAWVVRAALREWRAEGGVIGARLLKVK